MIASMFHILAWPAFAIAVLVFGFAPGAVLRLILLLYRRDHPRRQELLGELYAVPRIERPFWVAEQLEVALFEGLRDRFTAPGELTKTGDELLSDHQDIAIPKAPAAARAPRTLAKRPDPHQASLARQANGIMLRDLGDLSAGIRELRAALRLARQTGSADREADVLGSLGLALVYAGRTTSGLTAIDRAIQISSGALTGRMLHRRGVTLHVLGRDAAALDDFQRAIGILQRADDQLWTARALEGRGLVYLAIGSPARADDDFVSAGRLYAEIGEDLSSVNMVLSRGVAAFRSGDLPAALSFFDEAASRCRALGVPTPGLSLDRCDALLAAGLTREALAEADSAVLDVRRAKGRSSKKAELLLKVANCALAAAQPQEALDRAQAAFRLFRSQQNAWGQAHARLAVVQARYAVAPVSGQLMRAAKATADCLEELGSPDTALAHLLAGRVALALRQNAQADRHLSAAAHGRRRGPAMARVTGWLAEALRAQAAGESRRMLAACRRGLEVLGEHWLILGASELRAQATACGIELAALGQRHAVQTRQSRPLLVWTERWRAAALTTPAVRPSADAELNSGLTALREVSSRLEEAWRDGTPTGTLRREQLRLEGVARARSLQAGNMADAARTGIDVAELLDQLGNARLVEIVDIDDRLYTLVCGEGRVRQFSAGRTEDAIRAVNFARFALRRLASDRRGDGRDSAMAILGAVGPELQEAILGPAAGYLGDRLDQPIVVVPSGRLHSIPWALLPAMADRVFSVAPSADAWLRAHAVPRPSRRRVTFVRGQMNDGAEVPEAARLYDDATVLSGGEATAERVLSALDGVWVAHIAAHGRFRADGALFSSLRMHDGPLTVYDFEQLRRAPYWLVLSSCASRCQEPADADTLLSLASSLLPLGTAGIIASVVPLNDGSVVPLMVELHRHIRAGLSLAESLHRVRTSITDPIHQATAVSLIALGAG